jgi:hypothetical protein
MDTTTPKAKRKRLTFKKKLKLVYRERVSLNNSTSKGTTVG